MIYKALYDFHTSTWDAYGRVWMGEAATPADAETLARAYHASKQPTAVITRMDITESNQAALFAFEARKERLQIWLRNMAAGVLNQKELL